MRRFGNVVLANEAIHDDGTSRGLPHEDVPDEPDDCVVFESIRRYKGLEREVVVLVELSVGARGTHPDRGLAEMEGDPLGRAEVEGVAAGARRRLAGGSRRRSDHDPRADEYGRHKVPRR